MAGGRDGAPVGSAGMSRKAQLRFRGQLYHGSTLRTNPPYTWVARIPVEYMHEIGTGMIPGGRGCTNLSAAIPDRSLAVAAIDGVDPETAVARYPDGIVYVRELSLPSIRSVVQSARGIRWDYSS
jgi:hypothetical protein